MSDLAAYYDESYPPDIYLVVNPSTGATAGIPGAWTPAGSTPPATPAALAQAEPVAVVASPLTAWTTGQYVQTRTAGVAGRATWSGTSWVSGAAPLYAPSAHSVADVKAYIDGLGDEDDADVIAETQRVLDAERASDTPRATLIAWLDQREGVV